MRACHHRMIRRAHVQGHLKIILVATTMALVSSCASSSNPSVDALDGPRTTHRASTSQGYTLTDADKQLECNVIRGRMKVALFHLKSERNLPQSTGLSRGMQQAASSIFGGTTYGTDPKASAHKETARLYAYNGLLKTKQCTAFDLQKELGPARTS